MNNFLRTFILGILTFSTTALLSHGQPAQVNVAGDFNNWETLNPNMIEIEPGVWQGDFTITQSPFTFKFATPNFAQEWALDQQPHDTLPLAMQAVPTASNITLHNDSGSDLIRFRFDANTLQFVVFALNNVGGNLIQGGLFETASGAGARYWRLNQPNIHGNVWGRTFRGTAAQGGVVPPAPGTFAAIREATANVTRGEWWQRVPVEGGLTYEADALFVVQGGWTADTRELRLEFYDLNLDLLAVFTRDLADVGTEAFSRHAVLGQAPENAVWGRFVVEATGIGTMGTFRFYDARIQATVARRSENFNSRSWEGATVDACYAFSGWQLCTGKTVESYTFNGQSIPLSRSGHAASLSGEGSYIQSPRFQDGIGTISFFYRHGFEGDPDEGPEDPVVLKVQRSLSGVDWVDVATISNIFNTTFVQANVFQFETGPRFIRITHGGGTNRVIIDDITVFEPTEQPRLMTFDDWPVTGTNIGCHAHVNWQVCTGIVSSAFARSGKAAQILGDPGSGNFLLSPTFENGYGTISFSYRRGISGVNTVGLVLEASPDGGATWDELDRIENIDSLLWQDYSRFFLNLDPHQIRIRNLYETNILSNVDEFINEGFDNGAQPPPGWEFHQIGQYDTIASSGVNPPSLAFNQDGSYVITPPLLGPTNVSFMIKGQSISAESSFLVEALIAGNWTTVTNFIGISNGKVEYELPLNPATAQLRFTYTKVGGNLAFDDLSIQGDGSSGGTYQTLVLEDVNIGLPVQYRLQNFDSWPTKNSYNQGVDTHQAWHVVGNVIVNEVDAFSGQSARLRRAGDGAGGAYFVDFEGSGETKGAYAAGIVNLSGLDWNLNQVVIGTLDNDFKEGERSARLRGQNGAVMEMVEDKPNGIGSISFKYRRFGSDGAQQPWAVEYSVDGGDSWTQAGASITATADVQIFSHEVGVAGDARIRIRLTTTPGTTGNRRFNIDDIVVTDYSEAGGGGGAQDEVGTGDPFVLSHQFPDGIGSISFQFRNGVTNPLGDQVGVLLVQTSPDGSTWSNRATVIVDEPVYRSYDLYLFEPDERYVRIALTSGTEPVLVDDIAVARPQDPANVNLVGEHLPERPFINDPVRFRAEVTPRFGAHSITVTSYYRIGTSGPFLPLEMENTSGTTFESIDEIPPQPTGTIVQYYMEAWYDGPGADLTRPAVYPEGGAADPAFYGIPRNAPGRVWINEVDYSAREFYFDLETWSFVGTEKEFVELAGYEGADISGWRIEFRDGSDTSFSVFDSYVLGEGTVLDDDVGGFGFFVLAQADVPEPPRDLLFTNSMRLHRPGGIALYNEVGGLEHSIAYHGGVPGFTYMGVQDPDADGTNTTSVGLSGVGAGSSQFDWAQGTPPTPGAVNEGQEFGDPAIISALPDTLAFTYIRNSLNPAPQTIVISNAGASVLNYDLGSNRDWLIVTPNSGGPLAPGEWLEHEVTISVVGLTGNRSGIITVLGVAENSPFSIPVTLTETVVGAGLLEYLLDNNGNNQGTLGSAGNLTAAGGGTFTLQAQGVSGRVGDFAYVSATNTARLESGAAIGGLTNLTSFTISGWLRPGVTNGVHYVLGNRASGHGFEIRTSDDYQNLSLLSSAGGAPAAITSTNGVMATNEWTFFAISLDSADLSDSAVRFYRGTDQFSIFLSSTHALGDLGGTGTSTNRFRIGGTGDDAFQGWIDDVRVYDGVLTPVEVEALRLAAVDRVGSTGFPPNITLQPQSRIAFVGQDVELTVAADGLPLPSYQWIKDGVDIPNADSTRYTLNSVQLTDSGNFRVRVFNAEGVVTSVVAVLTVTDEVVAATVQPQDQHVYQGDPLSLSVRFSGVPTPTVWWTRDGDRIHAHNNQTNILINPAQFSHAGEWQAHASNKFFSVRSSNPALVRVLDDEDNIPFTRDSFRLAPNGITLRWDSAVGRVFDIYWSTNLLQGIESFTPVATGLTSTPPTNQFIHVTNEEAGFYFIDIRKP